MRTSSAKAKGRRACERLREELLGAFPELYEDDIRVVPSGVTGEDLWLSPMARDCLPFAFESKNQEKLNIWDALKQAASHSDVFPGILSFTRNRDELYIGCELKTFLSLARARFDLQRAKESSGEEEASP